MAVVVKGGFAGVGGKSGPDIWRDHLSHRKGQVGGTWASQFGGERLCVTRWVIITLLSTRAEVFYQFYPESFYNFYTFLKNTSQFSTIFPSKLLEKGGWSFKVCKFPKFPKFLPLPSTKFSPPWSPGTKLISSELYFSGAASLRHPADLPGLPGSTGQPHTHDHHRGEETSQQMEPGTDWLHHHNLKSPYYYYTSTMYQHLVGLSS